MQFFLDQGNELLVGREPVHAVKHGCGEPAGVFVFVQMEGLREQ